MDYKYGYLLVLTLLFFTSCTTVKGITFGESSVNLPMPSSMKERSYYPSGTSIYDFQSLVGNVLVLKEGSNPRRAGVIRPDDYVESIVLITDPENYYHSRIQQGAEINGSYLSFAAKLSANDLLEITITDTAHSSIILNDKNWTSILNKSIAWVKANPKKTGERRVWVLSVVTSRETLTSYTNIGADASGMIGEVVGVKTGVYNKSEAESKSSVIAFESIDIDEMVSNAIEIANKDKLKMSLVPEYSSVVSNAKFTQELIGKIE